MLKCELCSPIDHVRKNKISEPNPKCYHCRENGHIRKYCPNKQLSKKEICYVRAMEAAKSMSSRLKELDEIRGFCFVDDEKYEFLTDTGSSHTIMNSNLLNEKDRQKLRPTKTRVLTANGVMATCTGIKTCKIQHGEFTCWMDIIFTSDISEDLIIGMDFLRNSETTKKELYELKKAIDLGSSIVNKLEKTKREIVNDDSKEDVIKVHKMSVLNEHEFKELNCSIIEGRHGNFY
jgi:hypothetical protein